MIHPLVHDWNLAEPFNPPPGPILLDDETLRDGLQSPSVRTPTIDEKLRILHLMTDLGIECADIGLPGAGAHVVRDVERLVREIVAEKLPIRPNCAARTVVADIKPIAEIAQRTGLQLEVAAFIGSSPLRQYAEGWTLEFLERSTDEAISFAIKEGLTVFFVTEDTLRADPASLRLLYATAVRAGASRICVADTVGHATPNGARAVVRFALQLLDELGAHDVGVDWHGHDDRGLAVINSIAACEAGATRIHGTGLGVGERTGNAPMDLLLVNLALLGYRPADLAKLPAYCQAVSEATGVPIPAKYPVVGRDAFRTATGVHAAAIAKAARKGDRAAADAVYSGVPASLVGREQEIDVGPLSGKWNVIFWLEKHGLQASEEVVDRILARGKESTTTLTRDEILEVIAAASGPTGS
ncbi:MAG TPA: LeuA family protein [Vicinamibacterales bacterium]|nr:LeuA family protein [Vicinamibacterales bacterium]